ncbi:MAG: c-type cytochrome [Pirellulaceae bacterium]|nr:c-type cytochrome [Pirellulaceae bacterium]
MRKPSSPTLFDSFLEKSANRLLGRRRERSLILLGVFIFFPFLLFLNMTGCSKADPRFELDELYLLKLEKYLAPLSPPQKANLEAVLIDLYGTPNEPTLPTSPSFDFLSLEDLKMAAGAVSSTEEGHSHGLYRQHCADCHGLSGDGKGPRALVIDPYPRDYRQGIFKFKSTLRDQKPTHDDLKRIVEFGIPGTAMPSFRLLPENEKDRLVDYVIYLSIRGETERQLAEYIIDELEEGELLLDKAKGKGSPEVLEAKEIIDEIAEEIALSWKEAADYPISVSPSPLKQFTGEEREAKRLEMVLAGQTLFRTETANCTKCHGVMAMGNGESQDYNDWEKAYFDILSPDSGKEYLDAGAFPPRKANPRNLRRGVFRGGYKPEDIYRRIHQGIAGTPMPSVIIKPENAPDSIQGLTEYDIWCLVEYVRNLPYEEESQGVRNGPLPPQIK